MFIYHGTSYDNYLKMKNGDKTIDKNWKESEDDKICFYTDLSHYCKNDAYRSATYSAAIYNSQYDKVIVLFKYIDDNELEIDDSDGNGNHYGKERVAMDLCDFNVNDFDVIEFKYRPEDRAKYLYNAYNNTCGIRWNSIEQYVVNKEEIEKECEKIYNESKEFEIWFYEILYENNILEE